MKADQLLLGIMATQGSKRPPTIQDPFPGRSATFRQIIQAAREQGLEVCIFTPSAVDRRRQRVWAAIYTTEKGWQRSWFPVPKVVYNRVANRRAEKRQRVQNILAWLMAQGTIIFNPGFLDKWVVYAHLQADPQVSKYVPTTLLYTRTVSLKTLLREWKTIYCKPRTGSLGNGIAMLSLTKMGSVEILYNIKADARSRRTILYSEQDVELWARRHLRVEQMCLQRGVHLAQVRGRRFDIRALVQKDGQGKWRFTGAAGRVAAAGQVTTHVPRGGSHLRLNDALQVVYHNKEREEAARHELKTICEESAATLEAGLGVVCGEFSLDIGLDNAGRFWILEMNAKPFRFDEPGIRQVANRRLATFAGYLLEQIMDDNIPDE